MTSLTRWLVRAIENLRSWRESRWKNSHKATHLALGDQGESDAYFYLQNLGYRFVATNFRLPTSRGEIDLIGWDGDVLCFVEVKTRTDDSFAPPSAAVNAEKQRHILSVAKRYLHRLPGGRPLRCRFDVVGVVPATDGGRPGLTLHRGAFTWDGDRTRQRNYRDSPDRRYWRSSRK